MINFNNVWYVYHNSENGIKNISFKIEKGDSIALIGKNGAGKSTLINLLAGITKVQKGEILISDNISYGDFGICLQEQSIDWYLNAFQNIYMAEILKKDSKSNIDEIIKLLDLESIKHSAPDSISGGQQQRIQVARALIGDPKIYILDEPTTSLDAFYSDRLFKFLSKKIKDGASAMISSHDLDLLQNYCNKILYIENGEILYFGEMNNFLNLYSEANLYNIKLKTMNESNINKFGNLGECKILEDGVEIIMDIDANIYDFIAEHNIRDIDSIEKKERTLRSVFIDGKNE